MAIQSTLGQPASLVLDLASLLGDMSLNGVNSSLSIGTEKIELAFKSTEGQRSNEGANSTTTSTETTANPSAAHSQGVCPNYHRSEPPVPRQNEDHPFGPRPFAESDPSSVNLNLSPALTIFR
jgi:hypothetical protein